jgi:hypothetical protein
LEAERIMSRVETELANKVKPGEDVEWRRGQADVGEVHGEGIEGKGRRKGKKEGIRWIELMAVVSSDKSHVCSITSWVVPSILSQKMVKAIAIACKPELEGVC